MSAFHYNVNRDLDSNIQSTYIFEDDSAKTMRYKYNRSILSLEQFRCERLLSTA